MSAVPWREISPSRPGTDLGDRDAILRSLPRRISDIPATHATRSPGAPALRQGGACWSYLELARISGEAGRELEAAGVRAGDRVLVVCENGAATVALLFAIASLDAWPVLVNARLSSREIDAIREHCRPRRSLYLTEISAEASAHASRERGCVSLALSSMGAVAMGPLATDTVPEPCSAESASQVGALVYTSGTTGDPKGVMLSHRNLLYIARVSSALRGLSGDDTVYGVLPISHVYGLASVCLGTLYAGACLYAEARYSPQAALDALRSGVSVLQGVPSMYAKLVAHAQASGRCIDAPRLRLLYAGGAPLDPALKAAAEALLGLPLHNGYGLTEAAPTISQTRLDAPRSDCSVGLVIPGCEIRIVDAAGRATSAGPGELQVRGPNVMLGYYRNDALTRETIDEDGWLRTGDIVRQESDGAVFIVGRSKELIIRSGFNVYPVEVETVLNAHPEVTQSAVVGRAVEGNEEVVAFVELSPGATVTTEALLGFAAARLAPYKRPSEIVVLRALPTAATGKVLKRELKALAQERRRAGGQDAKAQRSA